MDPALDRVAPFLPFVGELCLELLNRPLVLDHQHVQRSPHRKPQPVPARSQVEHQVNSQGCFAHTRLACQHHESASRDQVSHCRCRAAAPPGRVAGGEERLLADATQSADKQPAEVAARVNGFLRCVRGPGAIGAPADPHCGVVFSPSNRRDRLAWATRTPPHLPVDGGVVGVVAVGRRLHQPLPTCRPSAAPSSSQRSPNGHHQDHHPTRARRPAGHRDRRDRQPARHQGRAVVARAEAPPRVRPASQARREGRGRAVRRDRHQRRPGRDLAGRSDDARRGTGSGRSGQRRLSFRLAICWEHAQLDQATLVSGL